jgi:serine/threonine protein phosphatase PrpC
MSFFYAGASIIGRSHETSGTVQDSWHHYYYFKQVFSVCVCDGAGSAKFSQSGAETTAKSVATRLARNFEKAFSVPQEFFDKMVPEIREKTLPPIATKNSCALCDLACTAVAIAVHEDGRYVYWHLGDGGIIARFGDELRVLSTPKKGEYANETFFITERDAAQNAQFGVGGANDDSPPLTGLAVFSDGLEMLLYDHQTLEVAPAIGKMLNWLTQAKRADVEAALAENIRNVFRQKTNDDCTLVLVNKA